MIELPQSKTRTKALRTALSESRKVTVYGLAGSATAMMLAETGRKRPMIVIADSLDDAGYLYHDLCRLCGEKAVAMLPSGYKRHIKYGQPDAPSQILRNEAVSRLYAQDSSLKFMVTYPEAIAERIASPGAVNEYSPAEAVTASKQRKIITTAQHYLLQSQSKLQPRFDVFEVVTASKNDFRVIKSEHIENAFGA